MSFVVKMTGTILIIGSAWLYSKERSDALELRLSQLMQLYNILLQLKSELKYMNSTLPECFMKLSENVNAPFDKWMSDMACEMEHERSKPFSIIWIKYLDELDRASRFEDGDIAFLAELKDKLGDADVNTSIKAIDYVLIRLEENRELLRNEIQQRKKVILSLSLFAGFIVIILLF